MARRKGTTKTRWRTRIRTRYRMRRPTRRSAKQGGMNFGRLLGRSGKDAVALMAARKLPNFAGEYQGAVDKIIAGGGLKLFKQGGSALIEVGFAEGIANVADRYVMPALGGILGGAVQSSGAAIVRASNPNVVNQG